MEIREHSITLVSVIVGLGLTELLANLNRLVRMRAEVRWHALPLVWVRAPWYHLAAAVFMLGILALRMASQTLH
jgi:hypothetical protein